MKEETRLPSSEDQPITFYQYPGGPRITFREHRNDVWEGEGEHPAYQPAGWIKRRGATIPQHGAFSSPAHLISRELALAATRQALLAWYREHEANVGSPTERAADQTANHEVRKLEEKIKFLEAQLYAQNPHSQLYRFGAGSLFLAVISIIAWLLTGSGIPFHPLFAAGIIPASLGVITMAFLVRPTREKSTRRKSSHTK
jgi:hypothetical protein